MTRQKLPDICNICGKNIESEKQYCMEAFEGRSTWFNAKQERTKAKNKIDVCHPCWLSICKTNYKPDFIVEIKNPNYVAGSKDLNKKYTIVKPEPDTPKQEELATAI